VLLVPGRYGKRKRRWKRTVEKLQSFFKLCGFPFERDDVRLFGA
jgi:hypothetical protein